MLTLTTTITHRNTPGGAKIRIERFPAVMSYTDAFASVLAFYTDTNTEQKDALPTMAVVADFPQAVIVVLAHTITHLAAFHLADSLRATAFFARFSTRTHMLLHGNTLANLWVTC